MAGAALTIEEYDRREYAARLRASYPAIRAFSPVAFQQVNYPTRAYVEEELRRYSDTMHETLSREKYFAERIYNNAEAKLLTDLSAEIHTLTAQAFGAPVQPLMCLFTPLQLVRMTAHLSDKAGRKVRVLEIGPGSMYLGAYLMMLGHHYLSMDNTQALYLWQNRLMRHLAPSMSEWALLNDYEAPPPLGKAPVHIPWWRFAHFHERLPFTVDVLICDAALGEMDWFAFQYLVRIAKQLLSKSDIGTFLFQHIGEPRVQADYIVDQAFIAEGFTKYEIGGVKAHSLSPTFETMIAGLSAPRPLGGEPPSLAPNDFLKIDEAKVLDSYGFFRFLGF